MITDAQFDAASKTFDEEEKRGSFYDMALDLISKKMEIQAYCLILATWNFARFRYYNTSFDIGGFEQTLKKLNPYFVKFEGQQFRSINFNNFRQDILHIFESLSKIPGVEYTGATKIMHLKNREVFLMWDSYINREYPKKYYLTLEVVRNGDWDHNTKYEKSGEGYLHFLIAMQDKFRHMKFESNRKKTFAKAVDEFNYVNITLPIQKMRFKEEKKKKYDNLIEKGFESEAALKKLRIDKSIIQ